MTAANRAADHRRTWWIVGIVSGVVLLLLALALLWSFLFEAGPPASARESGVGKRLQPRAPLVVSRAAGRFRRLADAIAQAQTGDRIVVQDESIEEILPRELKIPAITIEANESKPVVWRVPNNQAADHSMLLLSGTSDLCIRGFTFDGQGRVDQIIVVTGDCPGLRLEHLQLKGFKKCAILISNCAGEPDRPVSFLELRSQTAAVCEAGFLYEVNPQIAPRWNQNFSISKCWFEGLYKTPVRIPARDTKEPHPPRLFVTFSENMAREIDRKPAVEVKNPEN